MSKKFNSTSKLQTVLGFFAVLFLAATLNALMAEQSSANEVGIHWHAGNGSLTSGQYTSGTTNYPYTAARAYTSLTKGPASGKSAISNFVIRGTEFIIDPVKVTDDWVRDNPSRSWYIGSNKFRFGDWKINHFGTSSPCHIANNTNYINCFTVAFRPNKTAIDNFYGTAKVILEIAPVVNGEVGTPSSVTLTINGQPHTKPVVSMIVDPETANGLEEGEQAKVWFHSTKITSSTFLLRINIFQTGNYLDIGSTDTVYDGGRPIRTAAGRIFRGTQLSAPVTFYTINDDIDEQDGSFNINIRGTREGVFYRLSDTDDRATFAVRDNDVPAVTISPHRLTNPDVPELPSSYALFELTADQPTSQRLEIQYELVGTPYRDSNVALPGPVIINAGETSGILRIKTDYNINSDSDGSISVRIKENPNNLDSYSVPTSLAERTATVNVLNNNIPLTLSSTTTNFNVAEDVSSRNFVVNLELSRPAIIPTIFSVAVSDEMGEGKATLGTDFLAPSASEYQINVGNRTASITIPILDDIESDGDETFTLTLSDLVGANFANNVASLEYTITIIDEEDPILTLDSDSIDVAVTETDVDQDVQVTLNLSGAIDNPVNISYSLVDETATGGVDYTDVANGQVTILANTTSIPINLRIKGDDISEDTETFKVRITSPPTNAVFDREVTELEATVTITDDEPNEMRIVNTNFPVSEDIDFVVAENVVNAVLVIELELAKPATGESTPVSFIVETSSGTATKGSAIKEVDFKTNERFFRGPRHNFPFTKKEFIVKIPIFNDTLNEGNETFGVRIHDLVGATFPAGETDKSFIVKIIDDEKPNLTFANSTKSVAETDVDTNVELLLNLTGPIDEAVDISYEVVAETATEGTDYVDVGNGTVSILANTTSIPINIQIKGDGINEGSETFKVRITDPPSNAAFADGVTELEATVTITDDEIPTLTVDRSTLTVSESAGTTQIGLNLSGSTSLPVVVTYTTSITDNDTAQQADFTAVPASPARTATISEGELTGSIQIPILTDEINEGNETFTVTLTGVNGAVFSNGQSNIPVQVTIIDDEGLPTITLGSSSRNFNEESAIAEVVFNLSTAPSETVSIVYSTTQITATEDLDYTSQTNESIVISSGTVGRIYIPILDDNIHEGNETFSITISQITGAAYGSGIINTPINITIMDDETEPTLTISALSCEDSQPIPTDYIVSESVGNMIFNAKLSHPSNTPVNIYFTTKINTSLRNFAIDSDFFVSNSIQQTIHPGSTCTEILLPIINDELNEDNSQGGEQFEVYFKSVDHDPNQKPVPIELNNTATDIIPKLIAKIRDDDPVTWNIDDLTVYEGDIDTAMLFNVYFETHRPLDLGTQSVTWTASTEVGNTATFREDYAPRHNVHTGNVSIRAGISTQLIGEFTPNDRIETKGDTIYEPDETFTVTLSGSDREIAIGDGVAIGTILNDDPKPTLSTSTTASVNEADDNLEIVIDLSNQSVEEITLNYSTTDGTALGGTDYVTQTNQTHTISALASSSTIKIPIMNDNVYEGLETFSVTLSNVTNATFPFLVETIEINVAINDSKSEPVIRIANLTPSVSESTRSATITANLNHASTQAISLKYETSDRTATSVGANADFFTLTNQPLNFAPGETTKDITITINQDSINEGNESFTVTFRQANNASFPDSASILIATVTIVDDDASTLSFKTTNFNVAEGNTTLNVEVELSAATPNTVTFDVELSGGTATRHLDYTPLSNSRVTITTGTIGIIPITILEDRTDRNHEIIYEGDETIELVLKNLTGAIFANGQDILSQTITILDDDPPLFDIEYSFNTISEGLAGGVLRIGLEISNPITKPVTVTYNTQAVTATAGSDFIAPTAGSNSVTIPIGATTGFIPIRILNDDVIEEREEFKVKLSNLINARFDFYTVVGQPIDINEVTILINDDDIPEFSIAASGNAKEGPNATANFTITADKMPNQAIALSYLPVSDFFLPAGVTGNKQIMTLQPTDFSQAPNDGPITATLRVPIDNDGADAGGTSVGRNRYEMNGTIMVTLQEDSSTNPGYTVHATNNSATVHVEDNDARVRLLTISAPSQVAESSGVAVFTVTTRDPSTNNLSNGFRDVTVQYTAEEVDNGNFLLNSGVRQSAILRYGQQRATASLPIRLDNDTTPESTGKIKVTLHEDTAVISTYMLPSDVSARSAEATILDDDAPVLTIEAGNAVTEGPNVKARFKIISDVMPNAPIPIIYTPVGPGFIDGSGVRVTASPPINFTQNDLSKKYEGILEFDLMNDRINEPNGNVTVTLHNESPTTTYLLGATKTASVAVTDNDPVPTILITNQGPRVNEDANMITIPVQLTNPTSETVEITWSTTAGTASTNDFETKSQTLEIENGVFGLIQIPITDDDVYEGNEIFTVTLNEPTQARLLNSLRDPINTNTVVINVTIVDDEVKPIVKFVNRNVTVLEDSGEVNFTFSITEKTTSDVTVNYVTNAGTATAGSDFTAVPASPARTATISAVN